MVKSVEISDYVDGLTREEIITIYRALSMAVTGRPIPKIWDETEENIRLFVYSNLVDVAELIGRRYWK